MEQKQLYKKKGIAGVAVGAVITLMVGMGVATLVLIFTTVLSGQTYQLTEAKIESLTTDVVNQSFTAVNNTAVSLGNDQIVSSTLSFLNGTKSVGVGNFTVDYFHGTATLLNNAFNNTAIKATYTHGNAEIQTYIKDAAKAGFSAQKTGADYLPVVVLSIVIAVVLSLVLSFSNFGNSMGGGNSAL